MLASGCACLTFDDGPDPVTRLILDELDRAGIKATFFTLGRIIERHPDIARRIPRAATSWANTATITCTREDDALALSARPPPGRVGGCAASAS